MLTEKKFQKARDIFCFGCLTSLSFSDINQLTRDHIQWIQLKNKLQKTKEEITITLSQKAMSILESNSHHYKALSKIPEQKVNVIIKKCCQGSGIKTPTSYKDFTGGTVKQVIKPKIQLISTPSARKTIITRGFEPGIPEKILMKMTGLVDLCTLKHYREATKKEIKDVIEKMSLGVKLKIPDLN